jgi:hypothetical protein
VDGTTAVKVCAHYCQLHWDTSGKFVFVNFPAARHAGSYLLPAMRDSGLPKIPFIETPRIEDFPNPKVVVALPWFAESALSPSIYAYTRQSFRRNLYRIQLP